MADLAILFAVARAILGTSASLLKMKRMPASLPTQDPIASFRRMGIVALGVSGFKGSSVLIHS